MHTTNQLLTLKLYSLKSIKNSCYNMNAPLIVLKKFCRINIHTSEKFVI